MPKRRVLCAYGILAGVGLTALVGLVACARQGSPQGGEKDTVPPRVVEDLSSPNYSLNFNERSIRLVFNEWVVLRDANAQVIISPSLKKKPEIKLKGKSLLFRFDPEEVLRPNTTYTINFGTAIRDLHEENPANDLRFVFSTGAYLDSLSIGGFVQDAYSGEGVDKVVVALYDNLSDSAVHKEKPLYMTRSNPSGAFRFENLRAGAYRLLAFEDSDQDLRWRGGVDRMGFWPDPIAVSADSAPSYALRLFRDASALKITGRDLNQYGRATIVYSASPYALRPVFPKGVKSYAQVAGDTLQVWYHTDSAQVWNLIVETDTLKIRALSRDEFLKNRQIRFADEAVTSSGRKFAPTAAKPPIKTILHNPRRPAPLLFDAPIVSLDTALIRLYKADSIAVWDFELQPDSTRPAQLWLRCDWAPETYRLVLAPGALTDFYGVVNSDSLVRKFAIPELKKLGDLDLKLDGLLPQTAYIARLMNGKNLEWEARFTSSEEGLAEWLFKSISPLSYTLELIEDLNANQRWDPGAYYLGRQPERVWIKKLQSLRANWELEEKITLER
ncbi:MAG: Ig-like domain-containing protein [Saprospiraceae bacterium]